MLGWIQAAMQQNTIVSLTTSQLSTTDKIRTTYKHPNFLLISDCFCDIQCSKFDLKIRQLPNIYCPSSAQNARSKYSFSLQYGFKLIEKNGL